MKFSEMKYERPDLEAVKAQLRELTEALKNADSYETAREAFIKKDDLEKHIGTFEQLAQIRHDIDTRDEFYDAESRFWDESMPTLQEDLMSFSMAMLSGKFRPDFEKEFGDLMFINDEIALKTFSPEIVEDLQEENRLASEYGRLIASAQVPFEGGTYTLSQLTPFKNDPDDERRKAAWIAEGTWYKENQEQLDDIYDKLVKVRDKMGRKLGYDGYTQLGYYRMGRNCYTKEDIEKFREAVAAYVVPVASAVFKRQAERLGKTYPMSYADNQLEFRSGNPKPKGTADDILAAGKKFYDELSPETSEFFNKMLDMELLNVLSTPGKKAGGYCTGIYDYEMPFIFANFNGTQGDVEVVTHEAGHAFAAYTSRKAVPMSYMWPTMESCECHSMSMEFFAEKWAEDFFGDDTRKYLYSHLAGALKFIPYGTMVDHFQHEVYAHPEMTPKERHAVWKRLLGIYQPWMKLDGEIPFYSEGEGWQRQLHIYEVPFYYIDYCLAQTVALEFWAMIQEDIDNAWKHYMAYTRMGGSKVFTDLLKNADLESPFDGDTLKHVCEKAADYLANYDLDGIR
ncbi:MAG: M3 family oligoendopeptidase [Solobacterium sp.]|nr:M3 family oligoendopeptidase [Solobacterium sp.]